MTPCVHLYDVGMHNAIARTLEAYAPAKNPYLDALRDGRFDKADFVETQAQFYYAVVFFSRPMAVLAAKIPGARQRTEILRNVWEEHGESDPEKRHGATFLKFLNLVGGLEQRDVERRRLWPELRAFNTTLIGCCTLDDWEVGAALLGIIERMFAEISAVIGNAVVDRGWIARDDLVHYSLHAELDIKHSEDFFDVLAPSWQESDASSYRIEQGFELGAYVFDRLYRDLFANRTRRGLAPTERPQPHIYSE